ncbi:unnamed protein product [Thlaspi arvense]|uniref:Transcriptional regulator STERILE APETALA n=1 Tax=Thlaspi arvense TaxID=13288 RepID=A0AAU9SKT4_THLAR|nr:unnamed protein product [Thlaspi arvense]
MQVCSTWRAVSRSDLLWQNLTRRIWNRHRRLHDTWRDEFVFRHVTSRNFLAARYVHTTLHFVPSDDDNNHNNDNNNVREGRPSLHAASPDYLAAGFSDGSVRLFHLPAGFHLSTLRPHHRDDRLGRFSRAVSGIILSDNRVVFASLDGDVHVAPTNDGLPPRRAQWGDVVNDGALVDFSGCDRWWVGLYAGVPGRAFHVWNGETEELVFVGGSLTDPAAVMGWHLLNELTDFVGRVRVTSHESAVACTSHRFIVFDLGNLGLVLADEELQRGLIVSSVDAADDAFVAVDSRGGAIVRRVSTLEELFAFNVRGASQRVLLGCMNLGYVLMCSGGVIRLWDWEGENGRYLYFLRERVGEVSAMVADDRHVAACVSDNTIHLWDFGAQ